MKIGIAALILSFVTINFLSAQNGLIVDLDERFDKKVNFPYALRFEMKQGELILNLSTTKFYRSGGFRLNTKQKAVEGGFEIEIIEVLSPKGMATMAFAPAKARITLPNKKGTCKVVIKDQEVTDTYSLIVDESSISFKPDAVPKLSKNKSFEFRQAPKNSFGMRVSYNSRIGGDDLTEKIINHVKSLAGVQMWLPGQHKYLSEMPVLKVKGYHYFTMENIHKEKLQEIVARYKEDKQMFVSVFKLSERVTFTNKMK